MGHARVTAAEKEGSPHFEENKERGYARLCFVFLIINFFVFFFRTALLVELLSSPGRAGVLCLGQA